jgi:serine/threonine protein phosphatase PrpC
LALVAEHAALSDVGLQRSMNEDAFVAAPPLFAVADGMGGAQAGEVASHAAVEVLRHALDSGRTLTDAAQEANLRIFTMAENDPSLSGMGTTLTVVHLLEGNERAELVHVGDSRAYLLRDDLLEQLTADHSLVGEMVREGRLTADEAFTHPARSILSRVLGTEPGVKFDRSEVELRAGDTVLLCSDGLSSAVADATIKKALGDSPPRAAAQRLVVEAKNSGGHDNITVIVLRFSAAAPAAPDGEERTAVLPTGGDAETARTAPLPPPIEAAAASVETQPRRGLDRWRLWLLVAGLVVAALLAGLAVTLSVSYYVGVDQGYVSVFQGLPFGVGGLDLSRVYLRSNTPAAVIAQEDQRLLTQHSVTSRGDALRTVDALRTATPTPTPTPLPSPSATSRPSPSGRSSATAHPSSRASSKATP